MKKLPSKVAHNQHPTFFLCTGPAAQTAQKQKSCTTKSPLMQDWVFRLGFSLNIESITKGQIFSIWIFQFCFTFSGIFESTSRELSLTAAKCSGKKPRSEIWHKDWKTATEVSLFYFAFLRVSRPSCLLLIGSKLRSVMTTFLGHPLSAIYMKKENNPSYDCCKLFKLASEN